MPAEPETTLDKLMELDRSLLRLTFDQLRTIVILYETGSPLKASKKLGRDQSSVMKQVDTLNRYFKKLCGEGLATKRRRGEDYAFSSTGKNVVDWARSSLKDWENKLESTRRLAGRKLVVATTASSVPVLGSVWNEVIKRLRDRVTLEVRQIRAIEFWDKLDSWEVDLAIGGKVMLTDRDEINPEYDFVEWERDKFAILTNLPERELPGGDMSKEDLLQHPLVLPEVGIIVELLKRCYGENVKSQLNVGAWFRNIIFGLNLLRHEVVHGCMIVIRSLGVWACNNITPGIVTGSETARLRLLEFGKGFEPLDLVVGLFARRGDREQYDKGHPFNVFWEIFEKQAKQYGAFTRSMGKVI